MTIIGFNTRGLYDRYKEPAEKHNKIARKVWAGSIVVPNLRIFVSEAPYRGNFGYEIRLANSFAGNFTLDGVVVVATHMTKSARQAARLARALKKRFNVPVIIWRLHH